MEIAQYIMLAIMREPVPSELIEKIRSLKAEEVPPHLTNYYRMVIGAQEPESSEMTGLIRYMIACDLVEPLKKKTE